MTRFVGVYSNPNKLTIYPDGNMVHLIALSFVTEIVGGELGLSNETTDYGYFPLDEIAKMDMLAGHEERILDVLKDQPGAFIK